MKSLNILILLFAIFIISCEKETIYETFIIGLDGDFKLNEEYQLTDNPLAFSIIEINDSRCPSDVICVWQGMAELKIEVNSPVNGTLVLNTYNHLNDTLGNYSFELKDVSPYPISTTTIDPEDYIVTLKISEITE